MTDALCHLVVDANDVLRLKLVRKPEDIDDDDTTFGPDMCHQVFGDNESIFGYTDLNIKLYYSAGSLQTYLGIDYADKIKPEECEGVKADDVVSKVAEVLAPGYTFNLDDFVRSLDKDEHFKPYGKLEHAFTVTGSDGSESNRTFEVYYSDIFTPGWLAYHARLQTFILWYIDAASFIDNTDEGWTFFTVYEKYETSEGGHRYAVAGYATVFRYYAYPLHIRPRISQVLVLPTFRQLGLAANLVQAINAHFTLIPEVVDMTVEDPSPEFQRIRDFVDVKNCQLLPAFQPDKLLDGFSKEMAQQARSKFKLNHRQARRVYEILKLKQTNTSDATQYRHYRLEVKNRLNAPFQKKKLDIKKLEKVLKPDEYMAAMSMSGNEETHSRLNSQYQALEEEYKRVLHRLELQN